MWKKKKLAMSNVVYSCPECKTKKKLRTVFFGHYAQCANGCMKTFKRYREDADVCQFFPAQFRVATQLTGDLNTVWHDGCEHQATTDIVFKGKKIRVCTQCAQFAVGKNVSRLSDIAQAYADMKTVWDHNRESGERGTTYGDALKKYRSLMGYDPRKKRDRAIECLNKIDDAIEEMKKTGKPLTLDDLLRLRNAEQPEPL
jgi:hypothetical protein